MRSLPSLDTLRPPSSRSVAEMGCLDGLCVRSLSEEKAAEEVEKGERRREKARFLLRQRKMECLNRVAE